jgi:hypothetical protein
MSIQGDNMTASGEAATPPKLQAELDRLRHELDIANGAVSKWKTSLYRRIERLTARRDRYRAERDEARAELGRAGRLAEAADNVIRAVCDALGCGYDTDPVLEAERLRAELAREWELRQQAHAILLRHGYDGNTDTFSSRLVLSFPPQEAEPVATTLQRVIDDLHNEAAFRAPEGIADSDDISHDDRVAAVTLRGYADRLAEHPALVGESKKRWVSDREYEIGNDVCLPLRPSLPAEATPEELAEPSAVEVVCERCKRSPVWHRGAPYYDGRFCPACIDRCHEATEFDHTCPICASGVPTPIPEPQPGDVIRCRSTQVLGTVHSNQYPDGSYYIRWSGWEYDAAVFFDRRIHEVVSRKEQQP